MNINGVTYQEMDARYKNTYNRRCIDGTIHGCSRCKGYCVFSEHPGFLIEEQMKEHHCIEKGCFYFAPKESAPRRKNKEQTMDIAGMISERLQEYEGMKVIRAEENGESWTAYYVAIAEYAIQNIEKQLADMFGRKVTMKKLPYSFENAARLIFA